MDVYEENEMNRLQDSMERAQSKARRAEFRIAELEGKLASMNVSESHFAEYVQGRDDMQKYIDELEGVLAKADNLYDACDLSRAYERSDSVANAMDRFEQARASAAEKGEGGGG